MAGGILFKTENTAGTARGRVGRDDKKFILDKGRNLQDIKVDLI